MKEVDVIPVVVGALGTVAKGFKDWIERMGLQLTVEEL